MENIVFCKGGGCTAKLGAGALAKVLEKLPKRVDENLLVGFGANDDAAVYQLAEDLAVVQTLDFFPPMVDDPYTFGQIAAANALSDIYAMGAQVKTALNIVCFPESWDLNILGKILQGGSMKVNEAGGVVAGGHSIADVDVKYGLSVMGVVHPSKILKNHGCEQDDLLILTKPLGTGIVCSANRMGFASDRSMTQAIQSMTTLNKSAAEVFENYDVHGCTDITGFGLLVHLSEMLGDRFSAELYCDQVPVLDNAEKYAEEFYITAAGQRNRNFLGSQVEFVHVSFGMEEVLFDAQTSGGLLAALSREHALKAIKEIQALGLPCAVIGKVTKRGGKKITVKGEGFYDSIG